MVWSGMGMWGFRQVNAVDIRPPAVSNLAGPPSSRPPAAAIGRSVASAAHCGPAIGRGGCPSRAGPATSAKALSECRLIVAIRAGVSGQTWPRHLLPPSPPPPPLSPFFLFLWASSSRLGVAVVQTSLTHRPGRGQLWRVHGVLTRRGGEKLQLLQSLPLAGGRATCPGGSAARNS